MRSLFKKAPSKRRWWRGWSPLGVLLSYGDRSVGDWVEAPLFDAYVTQMADDGLLVETEDGYLLSWDALYEAMRSPAYGELPVFLAIPPRTHAQMVLRSRNALSDADFSISVAGWQEAGRAPFSPELIGSVMIRDSAVELMRAEQWGLFKEVVGFSGRSAERGQDLYHRQQWGG